MAVKTTSSRVFSCDVPDCKSVIAIDNVEGGEITHDDLPFGWHLHGADETHCGNHTYQWDTDKNCYVALPKRTRKARGSSNG